MNRIETIISNDQTADQHDTDSDGLRWENARLITEELNETYKTQTQVAEEIGKSQAHVSKCVTLWKTYSLANKRPRWVDAYREADSKTSPIGGGGHSVTSQSAANNNQPPSPRQPEPQDIDARVNEWRERQSESFAPTGDDSPDGVTDTLDTFLALLDKYVSNAREDEKVRIRTWITKTRETLNDLERRLT